MAHKYNLHKVPAEQFKGSVYANNEYIKTAMKGPGEPAEGDDLYVLTEAATGEVAGFCHYDKERKVYYAYEPFVLGVSIAEGPAECISMANAVLTGEPLDIDTFYNTF